MAKSGRFAATPKRGVSQRSVPVAPTTTVDKRGEVGIERGAASARQTALLGNSPLISRLNDGQRVQMIRRLQQSHGNAQVARAIASLQASPDRASSEGTTATPSRLGK